MKIEKILESVFIKEWNTTANILENDIYVCLHNNVFQNRKECFEYMNEYTKGLVQSSLVYRYLAKKRIPFNRENGNPLIRYDKLFDDLEKYASKKYKEFKNPNHLNSFKFKWYSTETKEGRPYDAKYQKK